MACVAIQMAVTHFAYAWVACIYLPGVNPQHNKDAWQHLKRKHSRAGQATIAASTWPICAFYQ